MMPKSAKFWALLIIFQAAFGVTVFALTRHFYIAGADVVVENTVIESEQIQEWTDEYEPDNSAMLDALNSYSENTTEDPAEVFRLANEYFANKQYDKAAQLYERLLSLEPDSAVAYNNLAITLHYLGRSTEALRILEDGIAVEPANQRIWLTLGFVNKELGNIEAARAALTTATQTNPDSEVGMSAARMLAELP